MKSVKQGVKNKAKAFRRTVTKKVSLLGKAIPVWALIAVICVGAVAASYAWYSATVGVEVKEPLKFGVNYVGWEAPPDPDMVAGYYSQVSPLVCSVSLYAGEVTNGNPTIEPVAVRESLPCLTIGSEPAMAIPSPYHTFNSMQVANDAGLPITVSFVVTGESEDVYMVWWGEVEGQPIGGMLNGYTVEVLGNDFIMRGIGVVAEGDTELGTYEFTVEVFRG